MRIWFDQVPQLRDLPLYTQLRVQSQHAFFSILFLLFDHSTNGFLSRKMNSAFLRPYKFLRLFSYGYMLATSAVDLYLSGSLFKQVHHAVFSEFTNPEL
jgi:hypothetical protein